MIDLHCLDNCTLQKIAKFLSAQDLRALRCSSNTLLSFVEDLCQHRLSKEFSQKYLTFLRKIPGYVNLSYTERYALAAKKLPMIDLRLPNSGKTAEEIFQKFFLDNFLSDLHNNNVDIPTWSQVVNMVAYTHGYTVHARTETRDILLVYDLERITVKCFPKNAIGDIFMDLHICIIEIVKPNQGHFILNGFGPGPLDLASSDWENPEWPWNSNTRAVAMVDEFALLDNRRSIAQTTLFRDGSIFKTYEHHIPIKKIFRIGYIDEVLIVINVNGSVSFLIGDLKQMSWKSMPFDHQDKNLYLISGFLLSDERVIEGISYFMENPQLSLKSDYYIVLVTNQNNLLFYDHSAGTWEKVALSNDLVDNNLAEPSEVAGIDLRQDVILRLDYNYLGEILYLTTEKAKYQYLFDDKRMSFLERFVPGERYFVNYALAELDFGGRWQGLEIIEYDHYK